MGGNRLEETMRASTVLDCSDLLHHRLFALAKIPIIHEIFECGSRSEGAMRVSGSISVFFFAPKSRKFVQAFQSAA
jgi:hypothetical protein